MGLKHNTIGSPQMASTARNWIKMGLKQNVDYPGHPKHHTRNWIKMGLKLAKCF